MRCTVAGTETYFFVEEGLQQAHIRHPDSPPGRTPPRVIKQVARLARLSGGRPALENAQLFQISMLKRGQWDWVMRRAVGWPSKHGRTVILIHFSVLDSFQDSEGLSLRTGGAAKHPTLHSSSLSTLWEVPTSLACRHQPRAGECCYPFITI